MAPDPMLIRQEAERKLFHVAWAIYPLLYFSGYSREGMLLLTLTVLIIWSGIELARRRGRSLVSPDQMREHEKRGGVMGTFYQVLSLFLAVLLFDRTIAVLAMLFCCVGDAVTGIAGTLLSDRLGKARTAIRDYSPTRQPLRPSALAIDLRHALHHRKSYSLMAVMLAACLVPGLALYPGIGPAVIAAGALGAVVADAFAWRLCGFTLNDDLTITLAAGGAMSLWALL